VNPSLELAAKLVAIHSALTVMAYSNLVGLLQERETTREAVEAAHVEVAARLEELAAASKSFVALLTSTVGKST
jgi:hypothetical protein